MIMIVNNYKVICQKTIESIVEDDLKKAVQYVDNNLKLKKNKYDISEDEDELDY